MGRIIASTYEIEREIGSGGGGVVYLGRHLRLNKQIVLKAYTRTASTKPAVLSREVDALKNLSHTYIPQVYDYVEENGTVYSVIEYIEGESLDKPLKRGERFPQPQIIQWACHLLDALIYLHSRPPYGILHSDIKPANIMLTPQGDIRLIDFNIALALGEEGAVRVGFSRGYASPEHYGISYASPALADRGKTWLNATTELNAETQLPTSPETQLSRGSSTTGGSVLLDVRSDIYSLGATLYHLLTGRRPASSAMEVTPILSREASPAVAAIIQKAMAPDPAERYQSAEEMLRAFRQLRQNDPRTKRHRRRVALTAGVLISLFLTGGLCTFSGLRQMERLQEQEKMLAKAAEKALAAVSASQTAYRTGDAPEAIRQALRAMELDSEYTSQAQRALTDALGVYELSDSFQPYRSLSLPSAPIKTALSPMGTRAAALVNGQVMVFDTENGELLEELKAESSALSDVVFVDEDTVLYAGEGALRSYSLTEEKELWRGAAATGVALSSDRRTVAAVYKGNTQAEIYDNQTGELLQPVSFGGKNQSVLPNDVFADPEDSLFALSGDGSWLAASFSDGSLRLFRLGGGDDLEIFDSSDYDHFEGGFFDRYFAFSASREAESIFAVVDLESREQTGGFLSTFPLHVWADESGILLSSENLLVQLDPVTGEQRELAYAEADIRVSAQSGQYTLTVLANGQTAFFDDCASPVERLEVSCDFANLSGEMALLADRNTPALRLLKLETHPSIFLYDREYIHNEARISESGNVVLYHYDGFRIYGADGTILAEMALPDPLQIYDQQYQRKDGCLEVIYNNGVVRKYSDSDGTLLSERTGTPPDRTLNEEFFTDHLRIISPLHGTPEAYDRLTGKLVRELEKVDYLTYVTQVGEYVITEYITAGGDRYGLLLNGNCETLARLPNLCDILPDGTLVFDDMRGNLRQSRIYSVQELCNLAQKY